MKKWISKSIFHFSILIIKWKTKKPFFYLFSFKTNFKKQKLKLSNSVFDLTSKNEFQKILSFFNFGNKIEKQKIKKNSKFVLFLSQKRLILSLHGSSKFYQNYFQEEYLLQAQPIFSTNCCKGLTKKLRIERNILNCFYFFNSFIKQQWIRYK